MSEPITNWGVAKLCIVTFLFGGYVVGNFGMDIVRGQEQRASTRFKFSVACADSPGSVKLRVDYCKDVAMSSPDEKPQVCIDQFLANQRHECGQYFDFVEEELLRKTARGEGKDHDLKR